jgi:uncharacterized protein (TIGR00255 family)
MTGFGRSESEDGGPRLTVEIKAINHRYSELQLKLPKRYGALEERLRRRLADALGRGKVEIFVKIEEREGDGKEMRVDNLLALKYHNKIRDLARSLDIPLNLGVAELLALPGVMTIDETEEEIELAWRRLEPPTERALAQILAMRRTEGDRLAEDFARRLVYLEELRRRLLTFAPASVENYRQRLRGRLAELLTQQPVDESRLAQEVAMFADRVGVDEELVRLDSHIRQFQGLLAGEGQVGRKLDFLCQEMNREINTVGSKAHDLGMTRIVIEMKNELEKLREQVQNIA